MIIGEDENCLISKITTRTDGGGQHYELGVLYHIHKANDEHEAAYDAVSELVERRIGGGEEETSIWSQPFDPKVAYFDEFKHGDQPPGLDCESHYEMQVHSVASRDNGDIKYVARVRASMPTNTYLRQYLHGEHWHASASPHLVKVIYDAILAYSKANTSFGIIETSLHHAVYMRGRTINGVQQAVSHITHSGIRIHVEVYVVDEGEKMGGALEAIKEIALIPGAMKIAPVYYSEDAEGKHAG